MVPSDLIAANMYPHIDSLPADLPFRVGYSCRTDGNMSYPLVQNDAQVLNDRICFFSGRGIPASDLVTFFTEHKDDITFLGNHPTYLDALRGERLAVTDAIFTRRPGTCVFLTFADCMPFVVYDKAQHIMAFAHIGWRSMAMGFTGKVLRHLLNEEGSLAQDLVVAIGPCIKKESYLFRDPMQAKDERWKNHLHPQQDGRLGIDLLGFCLEECAQAGLLPAQIYIDPADTAQDERLWSHYMGTEGGRPEKQGRMVFYGWMMGK